MAKLKEGETQSLMNEFIVAYHLIEDHRRDLARDLSGMLFSAFRYNHHREPNSLTVELKLGDVNLTPCEPSRRSEWRNRNAF
jgi:hypothetical protein